MKLNDISEIFFEADIYMTPINNSMKDSIIKLRVSRFIRAWNISYRPVKEMFRDNSLGHFNFIIIKCCG